MKYQVYIISKGRAQNVPSIQEKVGNKVIWLVSVGEKKAYEDNGARTVVEAGGLMQARNYALTDSFKKNLPCVQLSDDLKGIYRALDKNSKEEIPFTEAVEYILSTVIEHGTKLGGISPTANPYFVNFEKPVRSKHFVIGDFMVVLPNELRFDENLRLKEDYDYTLQHLTTVGSISHCDTILCEFQHYSNKGGAVDYRNDEIESETIDYLKNKWDFLIKLNPRRKNEILLNIK